MSDAVYRGLYHDQVRGVLDLYPRERVLILQFERVPRRPDRRDAPHAGVPRPRARSTRRRRSFSSTSARRGPSPTSPTSATPSSSGASATTSPGSPASARRSTSSCGRTSPTSSRSRRPRRSPAQRAPEPCASASPATGSTAARRWSGATCARRSTSSATRPSSSPGPSKDSAAKPALIERDDVWDQPGVTEASHYDIPLAEMEGWARENELEAVLFDQNYQFDEIARLREIGRPHDRPVRLGAVRARARRGREAGLRRRLLDARRRAGALRGARPRDPAGAMGRPSGAPRGRGALLERAAAATERSASTSPAAT